MLRTQGEIQVTTRKSEFAKGTPPSKQQKSHKWNARQYMLRHDRYTNDDPGDIAINVAYPTPGRGQNGESSN